MGSKAGQLATVVEARLLVREAIKALMAKNSYHVVCDAGSTAELIAAAVPHIPTLVILGPQPADSAIAEAAAIRKRWPDSKIVLLYEYAFLDVLQKLQESEINGCVSLFASPDTLIDILDLIETKRDRFMVLSVAQCLAIHAGQHVDLPPSGIKADKHSSVEVEHEDASVSVSDVRSGSSDDGASTNSKLVNGDPWHVPSLSEREVQILKGLVKGHANKVIARTCDISEATVKVHIKSILRKIRVKNRIQAAIWAVESGRAQANSRVPELTSDRTTAGHWA